MPGVKHESQDQPTLLEVVLRMHGDYRPRLEPIGVTPLQAGVRLYLHRQRQAKKTMVSPMARFIAVWFIRLPFNRCRPFLILIVR